MKKHSAHLTRLWPVLPACILLVLLPRGEASAAGNLKTDEAAYRPGQYAEVSYSGVTEQDVENKAWIGIAKVGASANEYLDWEYVAEGSGSVWLAVPGEAGSYEVRYYRENRAVDENLEGSESIPLTVEGEVPGDETAVYPGKNDFNWDLIDFPWERRLWTGTYETNYKALYLRQTDGRVEGEYPDWDNGRIDGTVIDGVVFGYWFESPSYAPPKDAGQLVFAMNPGGEGFTGWWRYGNSGNWSLWTSGTLNRQQASDWAQEEVYEADANHLVPDYLRGEDLTEEISIAEFSSLAVRLYEELLQTEAEPMETPFAEAGGHERQTDIEKAYGLGILKAIAPESFKPDAGFNRQVLANMLCGLIKTIEYEDCSFETIDSLSLPYTITEHYDDEAEISETCFDDVYYLKENQLLNGSADGRFDPKAGATREQVIVAVNRILDMETQKLQEPAETNTIEEEESEPDAATE